MYFYAYDSYDLTALSGSDGTWSVDSETNAPGYQLSYSVDWTGFQMEEKEGVQVQPGGDARNQLKYPDAPNDSTMLTSCTYHAVVAHTSTCPVIFTSGTVKPVDAKKFYQYGWNVANH